MNITIGSAALSVWGNATRTLTGLGTTTLSFTNLGNTPLANGVSVDLRPAAGKARFITILGQALTNVTWTQQLYDGTTFVPGFSAASGAALTEIMIGSNAFGPALKNTGTVSGTYDFAAIDLAQ